MASALLNTFWLQLCASLHDAELAFDIADGLMRPVSSAGAGAADSPAVPTHDTTRPSP